MNKTKKSQAMFSVIMLFIFVSLLFTAMVRVGKVEERTETVGFSAIELKKVYEKAEKTLFYIEQSGRYSIYSILNEIKSNLSICNESYKENVATLISEKLKWYIPYYSNITLPQNNYRINLIDNGTTLIANAKSDLVFPFSMGVHEVSPSFSIPFGYDLDQLCY
jgi:hypothetical protein